MVVAGDLKEELSLHDELHRSYWFVPCILRFICLQQQVTKTANFLAGSSYNSSPSEKAIYQYPTFDTH